MALSEVPGIVYFITWHNMDSSACSKCQELDGETWVLPKLSGILISKTQGAVYDLDLDFLITHPNCRCFLQVEPQVTLEDTAYFHFLKNALEGTKYMPSNIEEAKHDVESLRADIDRAYGQLRELEYLFYRITSIMGRMGLPKDIDAAIARMQRMMLTIRMLHSTMIYLERGSPYGWALGVITAIGALLGVSEMPNNPNTSESIRAYGG